MRSNEEVVGGEVSRQLKMSAVGAGFCALATLGLVLAASVLVLMGIITADMMGYAAIVIAFLGTALGALIAVKSGKGKTLISGICTAAIFLIFLFIGKTLFFRDASGNIPGIAIAVMAGGITAGFLGGTSKKRRK